jgi:hypothetical protein
MAQEPEVQARVKEIKGFGAALVSFSVADAIMSWKRSGTLHSTILRSQATQRLSLL